MKKLATMREALTDPALLGEALPGDSWAAWRIILIAAMGEELTPAEREVFTKLTGGREREPGGGKPVETLMIVGGRRSGKSCALSMLAVYLSCLCDWSEHLRIGETGVCLYQAPTVRQASESFRYANEFIDHVPMLKELVENKVQGCLTLRRSIELRAEAANWRYSRGTTGIMVVLDECAFFRDETSDNSDEELLTALMPSLATTGGIMCIASSPKAMEGIVWKIHQAQFGKDGDPQVLVVKADTKALNPTIRDSVIERALAADPEKASAEYMAEFREQTAGYLERSVIEKAVRTDVERNVPLPGIKYFAFVDPAGGSGGDSYATCVGHNVIDGDRTIAVIDCIYEQVPPFDPDYVTRAAAATLKEWRISEVYGDAYAGGWPVTAMNRNGIRYLTSPLNTSELYLHTLPLWTAGRVHMLDHKKTIEQFARLRRRVGQGVQEKIAHPRNGHDDLSNVVAGVLWLLSPVERGVNMSFGGFGVYRSAGPYGAVVGPDGQEKQPQTVRQAWEKTPGYTRAKDGELAKGSPTRSGLVW